ncbi:MAG: hypothetical protein IPK25_04260 [Saprospiraceae bacterium]|nr:hypothetical protein [Saprospiraceae bacterium]
MGKILEVGPGKLYPTPTAAVNDVQPGDTILIFPNTYTGGYFISNLHGIENKHIYFMGTNVETVVLKETLSLFTFQMFPIFILKILASPGKPEMA